MVGWILVSICGYHAADTMLRILIGNKTT